MKFRKRIKIFPGFSINLSKSGISSTVGAPGLSLNFSKKGTALNTGIPGTGLYDRHHLNSPSQTKTQNGRGSERNLTNTQGTKTFSLSSTDLIETSASLKDFCEELQDALDSKLDLLKALPSKEYALKKAKRSLTLSRIFLIGFLVSHWKDQLQRKSEELEEINTAISQTRIEVDMNSEIELTPLFSELKKAFIDLSTSHFIWDITTFTENNMSSPLSRADKQVSRVPIKLDQISPSLIKSQHDCLHFQNVNGGQLYFYPFFLLIIDDIQEIKLLEYNDIQIELIEAITKEFEIVAPDAKQVGTGYMYERTDGKADLRYKYNKEVPRIGYNIIKFHSTSGLDEVYKFSSKEKSQLFFHAFKKYQEAFK